MPKEVKYAGFWIRFFASFLDTLFVALPIGIVVYFVSDGNWFDFVQYQQNIQLAMSGNPHALDTQPQTSFTWELVFEFSVLLVTIIFWNRWQGATPGKKFFHVKIVDATTYKEITNKQAITRSLAYIPSLLFFGIGFFMVGLRKDKRGLHDFIAGTTVIYDQKAHSQS